MNSLHGLFGDERQFASDGILPSQYAALNRRQLMPEERLMLATLLDALHTVKRTKDPTRLREALSWIRSDSDRLLFSFRGICETLSFDADAVRRAWLARGFGERLKPRNIPGLDGSKRERIRPTGR
jgi:hypothetical protein